MKIGEFYKSIYNHYVSKVTKVTRHTVTLVNGQGVTDEVDMENFDANWRRCVKIYEFRQTIQEAFKHVADKCTLELIGDTVKVTVEEDYVCFSIVDDYFRINTSDDVKEALSLEYNVCDFFIEDALDVINTIGSLFE